MQLMASRRSLTAGFSLLVKLSRILHETQERKPLFLSYAGCACVVNCACAVVISNNMQMALQRLRCSLL